MSIIRLMYMGTYAERMDSLWGVVCYAMLCYAMLCYVMLCYVML